MDYAGGATTSFSNNAFGTMPLTPAEFTAASRAVNVVANSTISAAAQSAIYGDNFSETFTDRLITNSVYAVGDYATTQIGIASHGGQISKPIQLTGHAVVGCAAGAAITGDCAYGAAGQVAGELTAELYVYGLDRSNIMLTSAQRGIALNISQMAGAITVAAMGGDAENIYMGSNVGRIAAENNAIPVAIIAGIEACAANPACTALAVATAAATGKALAETYRLIAEGAYANGKDLANFKDDSAPPATSSSANSGNSASTPPDGDWEPEDFDPEIAIYEDAPYHHKNSSGLKSPAPKDGQTALNNSIKYSENSTARIGVDPVNEEFVVISRPNMSNGQAYYHGHVRSWNQLTQPQKNALIRAGKVTNNGKIIQ